MIRTLLVTVFSLITACGGGGSSFSTSTAPIADPIPMVETQPESVPAVAAVVQADLVDQPADPEPVPVVPDRPDPAPVDPVPANDPPVKPKKKLPRPVAPITFDIVVTKAGFEPKNITVPRGKPVRLRFERRVERTCGTEIVMDVGGQKIVKDLPLNKPVDVAITFGTAGVVTYACAMDMIRGSITVE